MPFTFNKSERICSKKEIDHLFANGQSFFAFPFRVVYMSNEDQAEGALSVLISVPKRKFKKACDRNSLKRLAKEAYRLNKVSICQHLSDAGRHLSIALLYVDDKPRNFYEIQKGILKAFMLLAEKHP